MSDIEESEFVTIIMGWGSRRDGIGWSGDIGSWPEVSR